MSALAQRVHQEDSLDIFQPDGSPKAKKITKLLEFKKKHISKTLGVPKQKIDLSPNKISDKIKNEIYEWGFVLNLVARAFKKDEEKTVSWFNKENSMLGMVSPKDMLLRGKVDVLKKFINQTLYENSQD